jgi:hypothetical protein
LETLIWLPEDTCSSKELCTFHSLLRFSYINIHANAIKNTLATVAYPSITLHVTFQNCPLENPVIDFSNGQILRGHNAQYGDCWSRLDHNLVLLIAQYLLGVGLLVLQDPPSMRIS